MGGAGRGEQGRAFSSCLGEGSPPKDGEGGALEEPGASSLSCPLLD